MKLTIFAAMLSASSAASDFKGKITITNKAPMMGTCQTPVWVGIHNGNFDSYDRNEPLPAFMESIVEDGNPANLVAEFNEGSAGRLWDGVVNAGTPICPGETAELMFSIDELPDDQDYYFSYASMVIPSNDAFVANGNPLAFKIFDNGQFVPVTVMSLGENVLDGGTEVNDEIPANTAAFGQASPNTGMTEGVVISHPGFLLDPKRILADSMFENADFLTAGYEVMTIEVTGTLTNNELTGTVTITMDVPTDGTCQTSVWVGIHDGTFDSYNRNEPLPAFMESLVEDGDNTNIAAAFADSGVGLWDGNVGTTPLCATEVETLDFIVTFTPGMKYYFSYASMVLPSNDAFVANGNPMELEIFDGSAFVPVSKKILGSMILDGGTEVNDELPANTAFFGQADPNTGDTEGVVITHPGFIMEPRSILAADKFANADFTADGYNMMSITAEELSSSGNEFMIRFTVTNLAPMMGTCQTPVWLGVHNGNFDTYNPGEALPAFMESLVEDGAVQPVIDEFNEGSDGRLWDGVVGGGPICHGESATLDVTLTVMPGTMYYLSYASMVIPSNDAFVANGNPAAFLIFDNTGAFQAVSITTPGANVRDGGTEVNDELPMNTAFFGQRVANSGTTENGVVTVHPGFTTEPRSILASPDRANADFTQPNYMTMEIVVTGEVQDSDDDSDDVVPICFSERTTVNVQGQGWTQMADVKVGDMVQTSSNTFEPVYSFAKRETQRMGQYVQIFAASESSAPLEMSANHFLSVMKQGHSVAKATHAGKVHAGDSLVLVAQDGTTSQVAVTKVKQVTRPGFYAPLTYSGSLLVNNGILVSAFAYDDEKLRLAKNTELSMISGDQWLRFSQSPHRILCKLSFDVCRGEEYNKESGLSSIFAMQMPVYEWWANLESFFWSLLVTVPMALFLLACNAMELLVLDHPVAAASTACLFFTAASRFSSVPATSKQIS